MVADVHRILKRGGVFLYPRNVRKEGKVGKLRLMYEGNPMAKLMEQAGGAASDGEERIMTIAPTALHQRVGLVMGDPAEVEAVTVAYRAKIGGDVVGGGDQRGRGLGSRYLA